MNIELFEVERQGVAAGELARSRGLDPNAMIKGVFEPRFFATVKGGGAVQGDFRVMAGSLCVHEKRMLHDDVLAYWRGFVVGLEGGQS